MGTTVDGRNPSLPRPVIYRVLYIPGGVGVLPSTVCFLFDQT